MIVQEILPENQTLIKTYSDAKLMIKKIGTDEIYAEAIDPIAMNRKYEETDIPVEEPEDVQLPEGEEGNNE